MKTILEFDVKNSIALPEEFLADDVRFSDSFAEYFINHYTKPGDVVFDPFAGFGTTLYAAEKLGRRASGVEYLPGRAKYIKANLQSQSGVICGDSLLLDDMELPEIDFVLTSPPYMQRVNHPEYPFAGYRVTGKNYNNYLCDLAGIFRQITKRLKPCAYVVVEISNLIIDDVFTPLAWDVAKSVGRVLPLKNEIIIKWLSDKSPAYGFGYDHSYALVFKNETGAPG